jgi:hypothetical protein
MNALVERYHHAAVFAFVYILEAHAVDEWPVRSTNADVKQHKSLTDRAAAASRLQAEYPLHPRLHLLLDNEQNDFNNTYASWPFRYWIVKDGKIALKLMPDGDTVHMSHVQEWCAANL